MVGNIKILPKNSAYAFVILLLNSEYFEIIYKKTITVSMIDIPVK